MVTKEASKIIASLAKERGIMEKEVRDEMQMAILEGYKNRDKNTAWNKYFGDGIPSPEEFVMTMATAVMASGAK